MKKSKPLISIVTPSYNLGKYIEKAIKSVLEQDYDNFEYFVIDGGSEDETIDILKKYSQIKKYKGKFHWISEPDKGQTHAINKGLKRSSGNWFAWINADDYYEPDVFSKLAKVFKKNSNAGVIYGNCYIDYPKQRILKKPPQDINYKSLVHGNQIFGPASFYNLKMIKNIGKFDENLEIWIDYDMFLGIAKIAKLKYININIANFTIRKGQKSNHNKKNNFREGHLVSMKNGGGFFTKHLLNRLPFPLNKISKFPTKKLFKNKVQKTQYYFKMKKYLRKIRALKKIKSCLQIFKKNLDLVVELKPANILRLPIFFSSYGKYKKLAKNEKVNMINIYTQLNDQTKNTSFDSHYFYQGVWAMEKIKKSKVKKHVDIGSDIRWVGLLSTITNVTFIDIRPFKTNLKNLKIEKGNILNLPFKNNSIKSLSCLHVAEHIGLGRYGDKLDPQGTKKACKELARVLAPHGNLYFSLPLGKEETYFNAHRVHNLKTIISYFKDLKLKGLSGITDWGEYIKNIKTEVLGKAYYSCGLFWFRKVK